MTFLTTEVRLKEPFRTFGMAFASRQLPASWTSNALISSGPRTCFTRQITLGTLTSVTVITKRKKKKDISILFRYRSIQLTLITHLTLARRTICILRSAAAARLDTLCSSDETRNSCKCAGKGRKPVARVALRSRTRRHIATRNVCPEEATGSGRICNDPP